MSTPITNEANILAADLVPFIGEPNISMLLVRLAGIHWTKRAAATPEMEVGSANFQVVEVISSPTVRTGQTVQVEAERVADRLTRARNNFNQWNNLPLRPGDLLLLACSPTAELGVWRARAARQVESPESPAVTAVRQCYTIEQVQEFSPRKRQLLEEALTARENVLRYYALDVLGRRAVTERKVAAEMIGSAIMAAKTTPEDKLELATYLTRSYFFREDRRADEANQQVVDILAHGLVNETSAERRLSWAERLASCVLGEFSTDPAVDRGTRFSLITSSRVPARQVVATLSDVIHTGVGRAGERVQKLLRVWQAADTPRP